MKKRIGFVSNSSSSSFIIRGVKASMKDVVEALGMSKIEEIMHKLNEDDIDYDLYDMVYTELEKFDLTIEGTGNYFGSRTFDEVLIGESLGYLEDGEAVELPKYNDKKIREKLTKAGLKGDLKTFIEMVSNDNY